MNNDCFVFNPLTDFNWKQIRLQNIEFLIHNGCRETDLGTCGE